LRSIWNQADQLGNEDQTDKAAKYHNWVALSIRSVTVDGPPYSVPRYLHLDLGKQTQRNVARFSSHSHAMHVKTRGWEHHDGTCDRCGLQAIQDEKHRGGYLRPKMGMVLACSQGMGPLTGSFQAYCLIVALVASRPQRLSLKIARQGACA